MVPRDGGAVCETDQIVYKQTYRNTFYCVRVVIASLDGSMLCWAHQKSDLNRRNFGATSLAATPFRTGKFFNRLFWVICHGWHEFFYFILAIMWHMMQSHSRAMMQCNREQRRIVELSSHCLPECHLAMPESLNSRSINESISACGWLCVYCRFAVACVLCRPASMTHCRTFYKQ